LTLFCWLLLLAVSLAKSSAALEIGVVEAHREFWSWYAACCKIERIQRRGTTRLVWHHSKPNREELKRNRTEANQINNLLYLANETCIMVTNQQQKWPPHLKIDSTPQTIIIKQS
jgi:hypothetical protein